MKTLAHAIDHLARGETGQASDILIQRLKALEMAGQHQNWIAAEFLELVPDEKVKISFAPLPRVLLFFVLCSNRAARRCWD